MTDVIFVLTIFLATTTLLWRAAESRARRAEARADYLASRIAALTQDVPAYAIQTEQGFTGTLRIVKGGRS